MFLLCNVLIWFSGLMCVQLELCRLGFMLVTPFTKGRLRLHWLLGPPNSCHSMYVCFGFGGGCGWMRHDFYGLVNWAFNCESFGVFCSRGHTKYLRKVMCCFSLHRQLVRANMIGIGSRCVVMILFWWFKGNIYAGVICQNLESCAGFQLGGLQCLLGK